MNEDAIRQVLAELRRLERTQVPNSNPEATGGWAAIQSAVEGVNWAFTSRIRRIADKLEAEINKPDTSK
jgi:hypothetical protein